MQRCSSGKAALHHAMDVWPAGSTQSKREGYPTVRPKGFPNRCSSGKAALHQVRFVQQRERGHCRMPHTLAAAPSKKAKLTEASVAPVAADSMDTDEPTAIDSFATASEAATEAATEAEVDEDGWSMIELRCAIGRDRLHDPAKLLECRHVSRCNFDALRMAGSICPVVGCHAKNRQRATVRDERLRAQLATLDATVEHALIKGEQIKPTPHAARRGVDIERWAMPIAELNDCAAVEAAAAEALPGGAPPKDAPPTVERAQSAALALVPPPVQTLAALIEVIKTQLHIQRTEIWRVLNDGERLCYRDGAQPTGTLLERARCLVELIGA